MISRGLNNILFWSSVGGFTLGVLLRSFFILTLPVTLFLFLLGLMILLISRMEKVSWKPAFITALILVTAGLGILRTDAADTLHRSDTLDAQVGEESIFSGIIIDDPSRGDGRQATTLQIYSFEGEEIQDDIRVRLFSDLYPELQYGDQVTVSGELQHPENFENEIGREFNYIRFLSKSGIGYQTFYPEITIEERNMGNPLKEQLFALKRWFIGSLGEYIPDPHSSLMAGITVGADEGLGEELEEDFRITGLIHIVVLSGYNVSIIAEIIMRLLAFLPLLASSLSAGTAIILFVVLTGASATIVRAGIMAVLVIVARLLRRPQHVARALALAGVIMLLHNPLILAFDPSFQLSFLATIGLIYFSPLLEPYLSFVPLKWGLRELVTATLATQLFVLPAILFMTGMLSLVAVPVNALVLPVIPLSMLAGFLTALASLAGPLITAPIALISSFLAEYTFMIVDFFAHIPFAFLEISYFPFALVVLLYGFYGFILFRVYMKEGSIEVWE